MLTICEAMQRCQVNGVRIERHPIKAGWWCVTLIEWKEYERVMFSYFTDDLLDAVIEGSKMRKNASKYC